jgi:hypothetical protein
MSNLCYSLRFLTWQGSPSSEYPTILQKWTLWKQVSPHGSLHNFEYNLIGRQWQPSLSHLLVQLWTEHRGFRSFWNHTWKQLVPFNFIQSHSIFIKSPFNTSSCILFTFTFYDFSTEWFLCPRFEFLWHHSSFLSGWLSLWISELFSRKYFQPQSAPPLNDVLQVLRSNL